MPNTASWMLRDEVQNEAFPQSWHPMALSREVTPGALIGVDFIETRVIVYRDTEGPAGGAGRLLPAPRRRPVARPACREPRPLPLPPLELRR